METCSKSTSDEYGPATSRPSGFLLDAFARVATCPLPGHVARHAPVPPRVPSALPTTCTTKDSSRVALTRSARRRSSATCASSSDPTSIELGICVADEWQGWGIGRRLFEAAVAWARDRGFETIARQTALPTTGACWRFSAPRHTPQDRRLPMAVVVDVVIPMRGPIPRETVAAALPEARRTAVRRPCVSWRRTRRPGRAAGG